MWLTWVALPVPLTPFWPLRSQDEKNAALAIPRRLPVKATQEATLRTGWDRSPEGQSEPVARRLPTKRSLRLESKLGKCHSANGSCSARLRGSLPSLVLLSTHLSATKHQALESSKKQTGLNFNLGRSSQHHLGDTAKQSWWEQETNCKHPRRSNFSD